MNYMWETFKVAFYLILIIGFILAVYYLLKNKFNLNNSRQMKVIDTLRLANGETVYLVKVFDEIVMLGGSKDELNYLRSWPLDEIDLNKLKKEDRENSKFKETFKSFLSRDKKQSNNENKAFEENKIDDEVKNKDNSSSSSDKDA